MKPAVEVSGSGPDAEAEVRTAPSPGSEIAAPQSLLDRLPHKLIVPLVLLISSGLAITSLTHDSVTYDETSHLTAGVCNLRSGDFRIGPSHPPLAKMWCAIPLLFMDQRWDPESYPGWREGDEWLFGRAWLFDHNDGQRLVKAARMMMVPLLAATCLAIYAVARRLYGRGAALLTLILAAFCSPLLAHGRLVTTDVPATLWFTVTLLAFAWLLERATWPRLICAALALSALSLTKFSWPLAIPAIVLMMLEVVGRRRPLEHRLLPRRDERGRWRLPLLTADGSRGRLAVLGASTLVIGVVMWLAIWTCFGWRFQAAKAEANDMELLMRRVALWDSLLQDAHGQQKSGPATALVRFARDHELLPEGYLFGVLWTLKTAEQHPAYLMGRFAPDGWFWYFPFAFVVKTEIGVLVLLAAGLAAIALRRVRAADGLLGLGLLGFAAIYLLLSLVGHLNIGVRHILPVYPAVLVAAGASAAWLGSPIARERDWGALASRAGKALVASLLAWLLVANLRTWPEYLSYFNEFIGGPESGYKYLADSNVDWGQDLKRLARWAAEHPERQIKLAYFGTANPDAYGIHCQMLPSQYPFGTPATLDGGTYVISVNNLLGLYFIPARESVWDNPGMQEGYRQMVAAFGPIAPPVIPARQPPKPAQQFYELQVGRLFSALRDRPPDERIGQSLFVYDLSAQQVADMIKP